MNYILTEEAREDLRLLTLYGLEHFGLLKTNEYLDYLEDRLEMICLYPKIGRMDSRIVPAVWRFDVQSHTIFYDIRHDDIRVLRILHKSADFLSHLKS